MVLGAGAIGLSWLALIASHLHLQRETAAEVLPDMPGMGDAYVGTPSQIVPHLQAYLLGVTWWSVMVVAMMGPATLPALRYIEYNTLWWRRGRAIGLYVVAWLGLWTIFGAVVQLMKSFNGTLNPTAVFAFCLAAAAIWQITPAKRQALNDCHRPAPLPPFSWPATKGVLRYGARTTSACIRACWAFMLVMAVTPAAEFGWMLALTGAVTAERFTQRPRRTTRYIAVMLAFAALTMSVLAVGTAT